MALRIRIASGVTSTHSSSRQNSSACSRPRILRDYLETYGDDNAYMCPAEASVGVNAKAVVRGIQREDKNIWGTMHFGLGTNIDVGGSVRSSIHMDGVILEPTLYVDGMKRIDNGRFLVPIEGD